MQDEVIAAYYLKNYGKNYHLPVVSAAYGEAAGLGKRSLKAGGQAGDRPRRWWRWIPTG